MQQYLRFFRISFKLVVKKINQMFDCVEIKIDEKRGLQLPPSNTGYFHQVFLKFRHNFFIQLYIIIIFILNVNYML